MTVLWSIVGALLPVCGRNLSHMVGQRVYVARRRIVSAATTAVIDGITSVNSASTILLATTERLSAIALRTQPIVNTEVSAPVGLRLSSESSAKYQTTRVAVERDETKPEVGVASVRGRRKTNEDRTVIRRLNDDLLLVGIFDGHGGSEAVDFVAGTLPELLTCRLKEYGARDLDLEHVLRRTFQDVNERLTRVLMRRELEAILLHDRASTSSCGTTATVCLLRGNSEIFVGHVGDSRAVLCRGDVGHVLTKDHSLDDPVELDRILRCSGHVTRPKTRGPPRVNGILEMTRSFGDVLLKQYGVTAEPEITKIEVDTTRDEFLALTTDGIHNTLNTPEVIGAISGCADPGDAAASLADEAMFYGSEDNCTAMVVPLAAWKRDTASVQVVKFSRAHNIFGNR